MDRQTLALARADWALSVDRPHDCALACDDLIAMAVGHVRQFHWHTAALTPEDFAILERRAGTRFRWGEHTPIGRAYLRHLNT